jgi:hypothetical protein
LSKFIVGAFSDGIYQALYDAGVVKDDPRNVRRVIIDLEVGCAACIYVQLFADSKLTDVLMRGGIELVERDSGGSTVSKES